MPLNFEGENTFVRQVAIDSFQLACGNKPITGDVMKTSASSLAPSSLAARTKSYVFCAKKLGFLNTPSHNRLATPIQTHSY